MTWAVASLTLLSTAGWLGRRRRLAVVHAGSRPLPADAIPDDVAHTILQGGWQTRGVAGAATAGGAEGLLVYLTGTSANGGGARALARLPRYRFYDVSALMLDVFGHGRQMPRCGIAAVARKGAAGGRGAAGVGVMGQLQQYCAAFSSRPAPQSEGFMVQQGLVVNLDEEDTEGVVLPPEDSEEMLAKWREVMRGQTSPSR